VQLGYHFWNCSSLLRWNSVAPLWWLNLFLENYKSGFRNEILDLYRIFGLHSQSLMQYANYVVVYHILYCIFLLVVRFRYLISAHGPSARIGYRFKQQSVVATYQVFFYITVATCYLFIFTLLLFTIRFHIVGSWHNCFYVSVICFFHHFNWNPRNW
jgi:hypothetical protein